MVKKYEILRNIAKLPKNYSQKVYISHHFFHSFPFFFYYFYALFCTFFNFSQLLDINTLNSIYNKDLHKYITPKPLASCVLDPVSSLSFFMQNKPNYIFTHKLIHSSTHPLFMQNEPNFKQRATRPERRETNNAKRTQFYKSCSYTHLLIYSFSHPPIYAKQTQFQNFENRVSRIPPIHPFTHPPIHPFTHPPIHPFTHLLIHSFMQNKPNLIPPTMLATNIEIRNTQYEIREKKICKTNPICIKHP
jgi:hypothetical protein